MQTTTHKHSKRTTNGRYDLYGDLEKIKSAITESAGDAKGNAQKALVEYLDELQHKYASLQKTTVTYVSRNPLKTVGITLATGIFLGFLFRR